MGGKRIIDNLGVRNRKLEIFRVLDRIFMTNDFMAAKIAVDNSDIDMSMLINWVEENIPNRFQTKQSVSKAYAELAFASRFFEMRRARKVLRLHEVRRSRDSGRVDIQRRGHKVPRSLRLPLEGEVPQHDKGEQEPAGEDRRKLSPFLHTNRQEIISSYLPLFKRLIASASPERKTRCARL